MARRQRSIAVTWIEMCGSPDQFIMAFLIMIKKILIIMMIMIIMTIMIIMLIIDVMIITIVMELKMRSTAFTWNDSDDTDDNETDVTLSKALRSSCNGNDENLPQFC